LLFVATSFVLFDTLLENPYLKLFPFEREVKQAIEGREKSNDFSTIWQQRQASIRSNKFKRPDTK
jgi:hypothetical protein